MSSPRSKETPRAEDVTVRQTRLLIDGEFRDSVSGKKFAVIDPTTEEKIAEVAEGDKEDVDLAVKAAHRAFEDGPWKRMDAAERGRCLYRLADLVERHTDELAGLEVLNNGKPISEALGYDLPGTAAIFRYYAGWADKIHGQTIPATRSLFSYTRREPVGVCGQIIPWNFPLAMASWKMGPALATGCTLVLKPAEQTPLTALRLAELVMEAGFPPGVVNIVPGFGETAGRALVKHPLVSKIAFTGEYRTAQEIQREAATDMKRLTFELGGKSPNVIFADADMDEVVQGAYGAIFLNAGENCCAGSRAFVEDRIYDQFIERLAALTSKRRLGNPFDPETEQGPQVDKAQFDKVMGYIEEGKKEGARCVTGGERAMEKGYFIRPTVFGDVKDEMKIARDEIFGPVVTVHRFRGFDEVVERANHTMYGLAAGIWTNDIGRAHAFAERVKAGTVWVNCFNAVHPAVPFGGFKMSGIGRELGEKALDNYLETKAVTIMKRDIR